jgi:hypothetical protein
MIHTHRDLPNLHFTLLPPHYSLSFETPPRASSHFCPSAKKVLADPLRLPLGPGQFFTDGWCLFDLFIVSMSLISLGPVDLPARFEGKT